MHKGHAARIALIKSLRKRDPPGFLSLRVNECLRTQSQLCDLHTCIGITKRFGLSPEYLETILEGLTEAPAKLINSNLVETLVSNFINSFLLSNKSVTDLTKIFAIHGVPKHLEHLTPTLKSKCTDNIALIGALRHMDDQRTFVWQLYESSINGPTDPFILSDYMSLIVARCGWHPRVPLILKRLETNVDLKILARLIRAYSHQPLGEGVVPKLKEIVSLTSGRLCRKNFEFHEAFIEFYLVNNQFASVMELITNSVPDYTPSYEIVARIFMTVPAKFFFVFFRILKSRLSSTEALNRGVALSIQHKSAHELCEVLEQVYRKKIELDPVNESRINELIHHPEISFRVRKRLRAFMEMISHARAKEAAQFNQIVSF